MVTSEDMTSQKPTSMTRKLLIRPEIIMDELIHTADYSRDDILIVDDKTTI